MSVLGGEKERNWPVSRAGTGGSLPSPFFLLQSSKARSPYVGEPFDSVLTFL
jgi:hypothetical protein